MLSISTIIIIIIGLVLTIIILFKRKKISDTIFLGLVTLIWGITSYSISIDIENLRQIKNDKLQQYLSLVKGLKMFLNENYFTTNDYKQQREDLQNAYFSASLLISAESMEIFNSFMDEYAKLRQQAIQKKPINNARLKELQNQLINNLRSEFIKDDPIVFKPVAIAIEDSTQTY